MDILVADSSVLTRRLIREDLAGAGYRIIEADDGPEALRIYDALRPALVTLSVDLPHLDGFQVCERIRAAESRTGQVPAPHALPVVFITASDTLEDRERGFAAGATQFLTKTFERGQVRQIVDAILKEPTRSRGFQALVAEDSALTRGIVVAALKRLGLDVLEAEDGQRALELIRESEQRLVIIVSDLIMSRLDGAQLCEALRQEPKFADVPFIVLSGDAERAHVLRMFKAGATDYLSKPFSQEELLARLRVHLDAVLLARDLERRRDELEAELELARQVQRTAQRPVPDTPTVRKAVRYLPLGRVSGDVYDLSLSAGGALNVFLGDATGHGISAAFMTMMVQTGLDSIGPDQPLEAVLTRLHNLLHERAGDRFVTGVYVRVAQDGTVTQASAGHPPIVFAPRQGDVRLLDHLGGLPLGLLDTPLPYDADTFCLSAGDRLYLYTDGLVEWTNRDGEQYAVERLMAYVSEHRGDPLERCLDGLIEDAHTFAAGDPDADDVTVVALEYAP